MVSAAVEPRRARRKAVRPTHIVQEKRQIEENAFYSIAELTKPDSPYRICPPSTVFRALANESLKANYAGRKVLIKGSAVHAWLAGDQEGGDA